MLGAISGDCASDDGVGPVFCLRSLRGCQLHIGARLPAAADADRRFIIDACICPSRLRAARRRRSVVEIGCSAAVAVGFRLRVGSAFRLHFERGEQLFGAVRHVHEGLAEVVRLRGVVHRSDRHASADRFHVGGYLRVVQRVKRERRQGIRVERAAPHVDRRRGVVGHFSAAVLVIDAKDRAAVAVHAGKEPQRIAGAADERLD